MHHGGVGDHAEMAAFARNTGFTERDGIVVLGNVFFDPAVEIFRLEENYRVIVADGRLDQTLRVIGGGWANHFQARGVHEPHLRILRVKWAAVDVAATGATDHQRRGGSPAVG